MLKERLMLHHAGSDKNSSVRIVVIMNMQIQSALCMHPIQINSASDYHTFTPHPKDE